MPTTTSDLLVRRLTSGNDPAKGPVLPDFETRSGVSSNMAHGGNKASRELTLTDGR
jgi:hypothetical protein